MVKGDPSFQLYESTLEIVDVLRKDGVYLGERGDAKTTALFIYANELVRQGKTVYIATFTGVIGELLKKRYTKLFGGKPKHMPEFKSVRSSWEGIDIEACILIDEWAAVWLDTDSRARAFVDGLNRWRPYGKVVRVG